MKATRLSGLLSVVILLFCVPGRSATWVIAEREESGEGSLRSALTEAAQSAGPHLIVLEYAGLLSLKTGLPKIIGDVVITGSGNQQSALALTGTEPLINVSAGSLTLSNLAFTGSSLSNASVISNTAALLIYDCLFSNNLSRNHKTNGGAIFSKGDLSIYRSRFISNITRGMDGHTLNDYRGWGLPGRGGAIYAAGGRVEITHSSFHQNECQGGGGAYISQYYGHGSGGYSAGGAIYAAGASLDIRETWFWKNIAWGAVPAGETWGGAIYATESQLNLQQNVFIENMAMGSSNAWAGKFVATGGEAVGGALYSHFSNTRLAQNEFRLNGAFTPPGVSTNPPRSRAGAVMIEGEPALLQGNLLKENFAVSARDIGGPIKSAGGNSISDPGGAAGYSPTDAIPHREILSRNPQFEWLINPAEPTIHTMAGEDGGFYLLSGYLLSLASFDRYGLTNWSEGIGYGRVRVEGSYQTTNGLGFALRIQQQQTGNDFRIFTNLYYGQFIVHRSNAGTYTGEQMTWVHYGPEPIARLKSNSNTVFTLLNPTWEQPRLLARKEAGGQTLEIALAGTNLSTSSSLRQWADVAADRAGNWYVSGFNQTNSTLRGWPVPAQFIIKFSPQDEIRWVRSLPETNSHHFLYPRGDGLLVYTGVGSQSRWDFFGEDGEIRWTKFLPITAFVQTWDRERDRLYLLSSIFMPPFNEAARSTYYTGGEDIIYALNGSLELQWAARLFGGISIDSMTLDSEGNLLLSGFRSGPASFHTSFHFSDWPQNGSFLTKLNTQADRTGPLAFHRTGNSVEVLWPTNSPGQLQRASILGSGATWSDAPFTARGHYYSAPVENNKQTEFFRLLPDPPLR